MLSFRIWNRNKGQKANVVLHLGAHKTGTSLVQKFFRDNVKEMKKRGIAAIGRGETETAIGWGDKIDTKRNNIDSLVDKYDGPRIGCVLLSHENALGRPFVDGCPQLYPRAKECAEKLNQTVGDRVSKVIYYTRSLDAFVESYYLQTVHQGGHETFERWFDRIDMERLSWVPVFESLQQVFGEWRVVIKDFGDSIGPGQAEFLRSFVRLIDDRYNWNNNVFEYKPDRNISIGDKGLDIALRVNGYLETRAQKKAMRRLLQKYFNNKKYSRPELLTAERKALLRERYSKERMHLGLDSVSR